MTTPDDPDPGPAFAPARLKSVPFLADLSDATLSRLAHSAAVRRLAPGEVLIHEGAPTRNLYIVVQGKFSVRTGGRKIAEIERGEPVGEIAFFAGGTRTADVVAERASEVLTLARADYEALSREAPDLPAAIIATLARRVAAANARVATLRPRPGALVALIGAEGAPIPAEVARIVARSVAAEDGWRVLTPADAPEGATAGALAEWLHDEELTGDRLLLLCSDADAHPEVAAAMMAGCDTLYVAIRAGVTDPDSLGPVETRAFAGPAPDNTFLVILRDRVGAPIRGTGAYLARRPVRHHHLAIDAPHEAARLARFVTGRPLGLILSGGGALGVAHLGALKALGEAGVIFDYVGGTSMGAAMGAVYSIGRDPEEVMAQMEGIFVGSRVMSRYSFPLYGLLDHRAFDEMLRREYGDQQVEDLPVNFFCIATNLSHNAMALVREGPVWEAVRKTTSIPAVFPPFIDGDGEVFVDGALFDNSPVEIMRQLKPGPNVVMNIQRHVAWRIKSPYGALPGRMGALRDALRNPRKRRHRFPNLFAILTRTMIVNSLFKLGDTPREGDVFVDVTPLRGMGFLDWRKARTQFDATYDETRTALLARFGEGPIPEDAALEALTHVAETLSHPKE
ncbi:MAG: patatin-like phospholipase family protein [Shimia sp.]